MLSEQDKQDVRQILRDFADELVRLQQSLVGAVSEQSVGLGKVFNAVRDTQNAMVLQVKKL